jgi:hypothetical protein
MLIFGGLAVIFGIFYWLRSRGRQRVTFAEPPVTSGPAGSLVVPVAVKSFSGRADRGRIAVAGLSKTFGSVRALDGLSFEVQPGRVTGFLGGGPHGPCFQPSAGTDAATRG